MDYRVHYLFKLKKVTTKFLNLLTVNNSLGKTQELYYFIIKLQTTKMTLPEIARHRILSQQINSTPLKTTAEMVAWFGAVQAQEYSQTKWALGLRLPQLKEADIEKDFNEGRILRTHLLRPTWHFVAAADIRWMLMLTAARVEKVNGYMYRKMEIDTIVFNRCNDILYQTLEGGKQLTRTAINLEFKKNKIEAEGHRLSYIMMHAELNGIICSGPRDGNQFTYALLEERVPPVEKKSREEALAELTKRFFTSRGPATVNDYATWSGLSLSDCRKGLETEKSRFSKVVIENKEYYFSKELQQNQAAPDKIVLLPIYDEYIMGYKDRDAILHYNQQIVPKPVFRYDSTIVCDGQIIGTWKRTVKSKSIFVEYNFFKAPDKKQKQEFEKAILKMKEFTGMEIQF